MDSSALHCRFDWTCHLNEGQPQFCALCVYSGAQTEGAAATQGNSWFSSNREASIEICSMSEDLSVELKRSHFYTGYIVQINHMGKLSISEMRKQMSPIPVSFTTQSHGKGDESINLIRRRGEEFSMMTKFTTNLSWFWSS